ncbi:MAG: hypothetical protein HWE16_08935 [Gammaproteobacteria bacterium]|nr:hypothetical protein [Gammaproteobacteria bacterium]
MKYFKLWALIAITFSFTVQAEQKVKVFIADSKNPSEINKLRNSWAKKYQRSFSIVNKKSDKIVIQVSPALSKTEQELFISSESHSGLELEIVNSQQSHQKIKKRASFGTSKIQ